MKKKIAVILMSVATVLSVSSSVFAATNLTNNVGVQANSKTVTVTLRDVKLPFASTYYYNVNGWTGTIPNTSSNCTPSTASCSSVTYSGTVYYTN